MPEVVEAYFGQTGLFEGRVYGVFGIDGRSEPGGENQAVVFIAFYETHPLLELAFAVRLKGAHRPRREVDLAPGLACRWSPRPSAPSDS